MKFYYTIFLFLFYFTSNACLWDRDTYAMEKQRFPEAYELITGNFIRHSKAYYEWRISKIQPLLDKGSKNPKLYDDLAVAYSKLHNDKKAISLMLEKDKFAPGLYETYANLGTFYIHDGQFEMGLIYIDKAIFKNPDAHFGREIYQRYLVEFVIAQGKNASKYSNFYYFLVTKYNEKHKKKETSLPLDEVKKATKGVLGMMRFGNFNSPILLNALGDILVNEEYEEEKNALRLGAMAYMAAELYSEKRISKTLEEKINSFLNLQEEGLNNFEKLQMELISSIRKGEKIYGIIEENESKWVAENANLDAKFAEKFYDLSTLKNEKATLTTVYEQFTLFDKFNVLYVFLAVFSLGILYLIYRYKK